MKKKDLTDKLQQYIDDWLERNPVDKEVRNNDVDDDDENGYNDDDDVDNDG